MRGLWYFLFDHDYLPWGLQVFWKALCWTAGGMIVYATTTTPMDPVGAGLLYAYAGFWFLMGLFTKLGA